MGKLSAAYREQTTKCTDSRVGLMSEIIGAIQTIKFYAWERNFARKIAQSRMKELQAVKGSSYVTAIMHSISAISRISLFLTISTYVFGGNVLTTRKIFVVSAYLEILNGTMLFWPMAITYCAEGYVALKRLREFLLMKESKPKAKSLEDLIGNNEKKTQHTTTRVHHVDSPQKGSISFDNVTGAWVNEDGDASTGLSAINLKIQPGGLYAIIGSVGSGKTSLLHAILGELELDSGRLEVHGALSYANQESFIFEGSVRSNILFTETFDAARYAEVVEVCGLTKDFQLFEHGDDTLVGEKGISLSGGQKARINLARAVYKKADVYLLDDPLSAVDSHVGKNIFKRCIVSFLRDKTVLLVTHQIQHLSKVDNIIVVSSGEIQAQGSYAELEKLELPLLMPMASQNENENHDNSPTKGASGFNDSDFVPEEEKENQEEGKVSRDVYKKYFKAVKSIPLVIFVLSLRIINQAIASFIDYFVAQWVNWEESIATSKLSENATSLKETENDSNLVVQERQSFVNIYLAITICFVCATLLAQFSFFHALIRASKNLHDMMFRSLTETFMKFFNKNSSGRILNRFSEDIGNIDTELPTTLFECIGVSFKIFFSCDLILIFSFRLKVLHRSSGSHVSPLNHKSEHTYPNSHLGSFTLLFAKRVRKLLPKHEKSRKHFEISGLCSHQCDIARPEHHQSFQS